MKVSVEQTRSQIRELTLGQYPGFLFRLRADTCRAINRNNRTQTQNKADCLKFVPFSGFAPTCGNPNKYVTNTISAKGGGEAHEEGGREGRRRSRQRPTINRRVINSRPPPPPQPQPPNHPNPAYPRPPNDAHSHSTQVTPKSPSSPIPLPVSVYDDNSSDSSTTRVDGIPPASSSCQKAGKLQPSYEYAPSGTKKHAAATYVYE